VRVVLEELFGLSLADIVGGGLGQLSREDEHRLDGAMERLRQAEPVQQVIGAAYFCGRRFKVCPDVLTPRPETAELCERVVDDLKLRMNVTAQQFNLLDVGTGSGCVAITLKLELPSVCVEAWDISEAALGVARENAQRLGAEVNFRRRNALSSVDDGRRWNCIVSNPPYVRECERADMHQNVLCYEPSVALFVPDDDPLLFYRAITTYAAKTLRAGGSLWFEINHAYADEMHELLASNGFTGIDIMRDQYGRWRMAKAIKEK